MDSKTRVNGRESSTVTVSWPATLIVCGEDVRRCYPSGITMLP